MNKLGIIIKREYLTRVKNKSFLIITFLGPIFFVALMIAPALLALNSDKMESKKAIAVLDETGWFDQKFDNTETNTFVYHDENENKDNDNDENNLVVNNFKFANKPLQLVSTSLLKR